MPKLLQHIVPALLIAFVFSRCAQVGVLGGGKRDFTPPKLLEAVPPNKSTNLNTSAIYLRFDEFVQVKDLANQLLVSPAMKTAPEVVADGRRIKITFNQEELKPSTTYRLFFGSAIADMHEGNPLKDFEYTFSTGPFIDTLKLKGSISGAFDNKPVGGVLVGLYDSPQRMDSLAYLKAPDYVARSGEDGSFSFGYLPQKTMEVFAFTDKNKNNLYDGDQETVSFLGPPLTIVSDTTIRLKIFQEEPSKTFIKKSLSPYYGFGQIFLNKKSPASITTLKPSEAANVYETNKGVVKDTISFFYYNLADTLALSINSAPGAKADTLNLLLPAKAKVKKRTRNYVLNAAGGRLPLNTKLSIRFPVWMDTTVARLSQLKLTGRKDSQLVKEPVSGKWTGINSFELDSRLKEGLSYTLALDTGAFVGIDGTSTDSSKQVFKTIARTELGRAILTIKLNKKQAYVIQLLNEQQKVAGEQYVTFSLSSSNTVSAVFNDLTPGNYTLKVIYDNNENKKWDTGKLLQKLFPEQVFIGAKPVKVLSDWETEEEFVIKE